MMIGWNTTHGFKFKLCGLWIVYNGPNYYTVEGRTVIMQDTRLEQMLILQNNAKYFKDFEEFKTWIESSPSTDLKDP